MKPTSRSRRQAAQWFRACLVNGLLDEERARQVVQRVSADKPRGYLGSLSHFHRLVRLDREQHAATIESTRPLVPELQARVQDSLTRRYGPGLRFSYLQNPELIAGLRIQVGSDVYDGSVRGRLAVLQRSF